MSRPIDFIAALWPANAIMLGLLLRHPQLGQTPSTWLYALLTFVVADWMSGSTAFISLSLNTANVVGVFSAWLYLRKQSPAVLRFERGRSVSVLFIACLIGSIVGSALGAWGSHVGYGVPLHRSLALWLSGEFFNFILFLPLFMAAPKGWIWQWPRPQHRCDPQQLWPLVALALSEALSLFIGGPGAIVFIMPAMIWAAISYRVFTITCLNVLVCFGKTAIIAMGPFSFSLTQASEAISYRTGLALMSLTPLAVACAYALRLQALEKLHHAVSHDFLTGVLARGALIERGQKLLSRLQAETQAVAVLMIDLDHFKQVNDRFGHAQGDQVLQQFAALAKHALRPEDLLGRLGGEEFAIILPRTTQDQAAAIGLRLSALMREHRFVTDGHNPWHVTVSIGLHAVAPFTPHESLEQLLSKADQALYHAKNNGRDQVQPYTPALAPASV